MFPSTPARVKGEGEGGGGGGGGGGGVEKFSKSVKCISGRFKATSLCWKCGSELPSGVGSEDDDNRALEEHARECGQPEMFVCSICDKEDFEDEKAFFEHRRKEECGDGKAGPPPRG